MTEYRKSISSKYREFNLYMHACIYKFYLRDREYSIPTSWFTLQTAVTANPGSREVDSGLPWEQQRSNSRASALPEKWASTPPQAPEASIQTSEASIQSQVFSAGPDVQPRVQPFLKLLRCNYLPFSLPLGVKSFDDLKKLQQQKYSIT